LTSQSHTCPEYLSLDVTPVSGVAPVILSLYLPTFNTILLETRSSCFFLILIKKVVRCHTRVSTRDHNLLEKATRYVILESFPTITFSIVSVKRDSLRDVSNICNTFHGEGWSLKSAGSVPCSCDGPSCIFSHVGYLILKKNQFFYFSSIVTFPSLRFSTFYSDANK
jgi:hypothetical protein